MQVSKWDDSLAVRLPAEVVESLDLKEGDEIDIQVTRRPEVEAVTEISRQEAIDRLRALRLPLPPGWKFDREEANSRDGLKRWIDSNGLPVKESEIEG